MKKLFVLLSLCVGLCCVSCYDDSELVERIDALEKTTIASINQQITAIKNSLSSLEAVDRELKESVKTLEAKDGSLQKDIEDLNSLIETLQDKDVLQQSDIDAIKSAIQNLETEDEAIQGEIDSLKKMIESLESKDEVLAEDIDKLVSAMQNVEEKLEEMQKAIDSLKNADEELDAKIDNLSKYIDGELKSSKDWVEATYATLAQYDSLAAVLATIKVNISDLEDELTAAIGEAIEDSQESMKEWVNEQLTGYWSIAESEAKLKNLKDSTDAEIVAIKKELNKTSEDLTKAYKDAIAEAIKESEGKLSDKIDEINAALEDKIAKIESRLAAVEEKLAIITREFAIQFEDYDIGILPGGTTSVGYTITGATDKTTVKALGQNGWSAKVVQNGKDKGKITVTAPNPMTDDEIIVLVYDGEYRTIMSSVNFVTGVVTPSQIAIELEAEAGTVDVSVTSNLKFQVSIPEDAKDWLSIIETKSLKTGCITFSYTTNEFTVRETDVSFIDEANNVFTKISFVQQGSVTEINLTEAGSFLNAIGADFLHKTKALKVNGPLNGTDIKYIRQMDALKSLDLTDAQIVSGGDAYCVASYGSSLKTSNNVVGREMFYRTELEKIYLPNGVTTIDQDAFGWCRNLKEVRMGNEVVVIGDNAFSVCSSLEQISLSTKIKRLGNGVFNSSGIKNIHLHSDIEYIGPNCFNNCATLGSIVIPAKTNTIGERAFNGCFALKEIHVKANSQTLLNIGTDLFSYFSSSGTDNSLYEKAVLYIPEGSRTYYLTTDFGRFKNIIEE